MGRARVFTWKGNFFPLSWNHFVVVRRLTKWHNFTLLTALFRHCKTFWGAFGIVIIIFCLWAIMRGGWFSWENVWDYGFGSVISVTYCRFCFVNELQRYGVSLPVRDNTMQRISSWKERISPLCVSRANSKMLKLNVWKLSPFINMYTQ